jgi:hypothetical protein
MEPTGIFVGTWVDLSKKKTNVNIMQKTAGIRSFQKPDGKMTI